MNVLRKICVVTGSRAEYGLLYYLLKEIDLDPQLKLQLIVSGMHLSPNYGYTCHEIEREFSITKKIEVLLSSDTSAGIGKSIGLGIISMVDALKELSPDLIVLLGDRYEILSAAMAAMVLQIPIAHIHGGEVTEGAMDEAIRHSITKMSHLHFTATEEYRKRVIQLGEDPKKVFNFGAPGLDALKKIDFLSRKEIEKKLQWKFREKNILVTFHPETLEPEKSLEHFKELLRVLKELTNFGVIITGANADHGGSTINFMAKNFCESLGDNYIFLINMGRHLYLSTMKQVDAVVGNSSSGIIEAPSLKVPTVNIGNRQKGRIQAKSILNCEPAYQSIKQCILQAISKEFRENVMDVVNPYGCGDASVKIKNILKKYPIKNILRKKFYSLNRNHK